MSHCGGFDGDLPALVVIPALIFDNPSGCGGLSSTRMHAASAAMPSHNEIIGVSFGVSIERTLLSE